MSETVRDWGQFWTPDWIADAMVEYVAAGLGREREFLCLFDPCVGSGSFYEASKRIERERGGRIRFSGVEIDEQVLGEWVKREGGIKVGDFLWEDISASSLEGIVGNPPYVRHHRLSAKVKERGRSLCESIVGKKLDGRAGLHIYFLVYALHLLAKGGRLAFIMPADVCEGKFASDLWEWISYKYRIDSILTFKPEASPFPDVDINPIITFIEHKPAKEKTYYWVECREPGSKHLQRWAGLSFEERGSYSCHELVICPRDLQEGVRFGISKSPLISGNSKTSRYKLKDFARVCRGIATGANEFFLLNSKQVEMLGVGSEYFQRVIRRTKDIVGDEINFETLDVLDRGGIPTFLLSIPKGKERHDLPKNLELYLRHGEFLGLPMRPLLSRRHPWYQGEVRQPPAILFTYLGRRRCRFIRNQAQVVPLTTFLCLYPQDNDWSYTEFVWQLLNHSQTLESLQLVSKSYGGGAIKVEPRSLEELPILDEVIESIIEKQIKYKS